VSWGGAATHEVKTDGDHILTVSVSGDVDGWPVFLLHGTPGSRVGPKPRGSVLYRRGIRLICYDRPGYGGSTRRQGRRVAHAADDVSAIAADLRLNKFSVVGRSGGGPHALACAALLPTNVFRAAALVSLAPNAPDLDWFQGMNSSNVDEYTVADSDRAELDARITSKANGTLRDPLGLMEELEPQLSKADRMILADWALRGLIADAYNEALRDGPNGWIDDIVAFRAGWGFEVGTIGVPVLLWHGVEDSLAPVSHTEWLAKRIATARVILQPRAAHFGAVEVLPDVLTWLSPWQPMNEVGDSGPSERLRIDHSMK